MKNSISETWKVIRSFYDSQFMTMNIIIDDKASHNGSNYSKYISEDWVKLPQVYELKIIHKNGDFNLKILTKSLLPCIEPTSIRELTFQNIDKPNSLIKVLTNFSKLSKNKIRVLSLKNCKLPGNFLGKFNDLMNVFVFSLYVLLDINYSNCIIFHTSSTCWYNYIWVYLIKSSI